MKHILIVDDDDQVRNMLKIFLERKGYLVTVACDGEEALCLLNEENTHLIIIDIIMPNKEGLETILEIRKLQNDVKIIAISGGGQVDPMDYLSAAQKFGANLCFSKPMDHKKLLQGIEKLLAEE